MVLILDGNSEIGAHVRSNLCYLICLGHWIRSRVVINRDFFYEKNPILFMHAQFILSYHLIYPYHAHDDLGWKFGKSLSLNLGLVSVWFQGELKQSSQTVENQTKKHKE